MATTPTTNFKARALTPGTVEPAIPVNSNTAKEMGMGSGNQASKIMTATKANMWMIRNMGMECIGGVMGRFMMGSSGRI